MRKHLLKSSVAKILPVNRAGWFVITSTLVVAAGCILTSFAVRAYNKETSNPPATPPTYVSGGGAQPKLSAAGLQGITSKPTEIAVVTIRPTGFEPTEIIRSKGVFFMAVENRSGLQTMQLRMESESGIRLHEAQVSKRKHDWQQSFNLPPGRYKLTEAYHPDWACTIIVEGK